jgi:hypothetical protein
VNKSAILAELARAGSHLIGRSPEATAATENAVRGAVGTLETGAKKLLNTPIAGTPELLPRKLTGPLRKGVDFAIENPETILGTATPIPGGGMLAHAGKRALERGLNRITPPAALVPKLGFAVSQYSGPLNPVIHSGASSLPPFKAPRLDRAIQKSAFATTYSAGPSPDWAHDAPPANGASSLPPRRVPRLDVAVQKSAAAELEFFLLKFSSDVNLGQWWEQKGGPHLAKGGSHAAFKQMMDKEKFPEHVKKKFMDVAAKKYPPQYNKRSGGGAAWAKREAGRVEKPGFMSYVAKHPVATGLAAGAGILGAGYLADRISQHTSKRKAAASAPTRGNFMMASDLPSYRPPRLDQAIQKDGAYESEPYTSVFKGADLEGEKKTKVKAGDMLPDYVTYNPGDFKRSKYAMPIEELAYLVDGLLKEAIPGLTPQSRLEQSSAIGAPRANPPPLPGPSIADQAKPKGPGFGTGIAGANKSTIGGQSIGGIGRMAPPAQV